jgi:ABC-type dipeptide/oligopeptide/nickel transport system ATPase subunit
MLLNLFQSRDIHHRSKHHHDREFLRSVSMLSYQDYESNLNPRHAQFHRLISHDIGMKKSSNEYNFLNKEDIMRTYERLHMDSDDADDEDDDQTPTPGHPTLKFP